MPDSSPGLPEGSAGRRVRRCEVGSALAGVTARPGPLEELPTAQADPPSHGETPKCPTGRARWWPSLGEQGAGVVGPGEVGCPHF